MYSVCYVVYCVISMWYCMHMVCIVCMWYVLYARTVYQRTSTKVNLEIQGESRFASKFLRRQVNPNIQWSIYTDFTRGFKCTVFCYKQLEFDVQTAQPAMWPRFAWILPTSLIWVFSPFASFCFMLLTTTTILIAALCLPIQHSVEPC